MRPTKLPNGNYLLPKRAEGTHGVIGDGCIEVPPDNPELIAALAYWERVDTLLAKHSSVAAD